jgi:hypothetical protein
MIFLPQTLSTPASMPARKLARMEAQPVISWTVPLLLTAGWQWLIAETQQDALPRSEG